MPKSAKEVVIDEIEHQLMRLLENRTPQAEVLLTIYDGIPTLIENSRREMDANGIISTDITILLSIENIFRKEVDKIFGREDISISFPTFAPTSHYDRDFDDRKPSFGGDSHYFDSGSH